MEDLNNMPGVHEITKVLHTIAGALRWAIEESGGEVFYHREGTGKMYPTKAEQDEAQRTCPQCHPELRKRD